MDIMPVQFLALNGKGKKIMTNQRFKRDWRGMAITISIIAAILGAIALEYAVMGEAYGL